MMLSSNFFVKYYFSLHFLMMFASWISQVLRINYFKWWTINFDLVMVRLLRMKPDGGVVYMRNANNGGEECCHQKSRRRSGGRDESLLVQTSDRCSGAPSRLFVKILYWPSFPFFIFLQIRMCVQPNLIWPLQLFSNMIMQNMIIFCFKNPSWPWLQLLRYNTKDQLVMGTGRKVWGASYVGAGKSYKHWH